MTTLNLILLILGVVEPILAGGGVIPPQYQGLAQGILGAVTAVKNDLTGPNAQLNLTAVSATQAIAAGLLALETAGALPKDKNVSLAIALSDAAAAGAAAFVAAGQNVDPTALKPEAPVA